MADQTPQIEGRTEEQRRRQREASERFYAKHPERVKGWVRRYQTERNREGFLDLQTMVREKRPTPPRPRPDKCELCDGVNRDGTRIFYDHCHKSGKFRGWLCRRCNLLLGWAKDSPELLRKLADYLEVHAHG